MVTKLYYYIFLSIFLTSCNNSLEKHKIFCAISDCNVLETDVKEKKVNSFNVEYIDSTEAKGCLKVQLINNYIVHVDNNSVILLYTKELEKDIGFLKSSYYNFESDSTRITNYSRYSDKEIIITIGRKKCLKQGGYITNMDTTCVYDYKYFEERKGLFIEKQKKND